MATGGAREEAQREGARTTRQAGPGSRQEPPEGARQAPARREDPSGPDAGRGLRESRDAREPQGLARGRPAAAPVRRPPAERPSGVRAGGSRGDSLDRALRNLVLALVLGIVGATVLLAKDLDERDTVIAVAVATGVLLALAVATRPLRGVGSWAWSAVIAAFVLSRSTTVLATGKVWVVRDATVHILGIPQVLVATGHLPSEAVDPDVVFYRSYPALHYALTSFHFVTGLPLWEGSAVLALAIGIGALALVGLATRVVFPRAGVLAGAAFVIAPLAIGLHQSLQPLAFAMLCLAAFAHLLARPPAHLEGTFFALTGILLAATHPYSTAIVGAAILLSVLLLALLLRQLRFMLPLGLGVVGAVTYLGLLARDFDLLLGSLSPPTRQGIIVDPSGGGSASGPSAQMVFVETWKFRLPVLGALAGWGLAWSERPRLKALPLQVLAVVLGGLYVAALAVPGAFPTRVLALSAVAVAPFLGYALLRMTPFAAAPFVLVVALLAGTSIHAADQYTPWAREGQPLPQPLDEPAGLDALTEYFLTIEGGRLRVTNPISSHFIFNGSTVLPVRGFSAVDAIGTAPREYYFYREAAAETGFAVTRPGGGREGTFSHYPTAANLEFLASIDRIADVGEVQLHRN